MTTQTTAVDAAAKPRVKSWHYAWIIVGVTFFVLLVSSGVRTLPSIIIKPLEAEFGWDRASISFSVMISLFVYGFGGAFGGSLIDRFGPRRVMLGGLALSALRLVPLLVLTNLIQLHLLWGVIVGAGTGSVASVIGATVAHRWFHSHRGLVIGLFGAAGASGQLIFLPSLVGINELAGWRAALALMALATAALLVPTVFLMRNRPQDVGARRFGEPERLPTEAEAKSDARGTPLAEAVRARDFWLLAGSFFVCGYTTNGLIGTHLLPHTIEHGFDPAATAGALGLMGMMNVVGTLASGWLSDRYDNRKLLATYYGFRALSLCALPFIIDMRGLALFAIVYGLDWVATVPATVNLTATRFGKASLGTLYGWIFCSHMIGAGIAAFAGGFFRDLMGDYHLMFLSAAVMGFIAVFLSMNITPQRKVIPLASTQ